MSNRRRMPVKQAAPMSMEERIAEKDRILNEEKKRREHAERLQFDSNFRDAQEKLNQEREKAENDRRRMETERANNDEAAKRKQKQDEERNAREEEERKKRVEIELQKKLEDDRRRADERRKKIEEDRKKRQDEERKQMEERRRIQEEETRRLEMETAELAMRAANNDFSFLSHQQQEQPTFNLAEEIDLLGGSEDGGSSKSGSEYEGSEYSYDGYSEGSRGQLTSHRLAPQRGTIDEHTDNYLDRLDCPAVSIKKHGKQDGSYIFGQKMMRVQIDRGTRELKVNVSNKLMSIQDFINKFERVEVLREKGLKSALLVTSMLNQPKSNLDLMIS